MYSSPWTEVTMFPQTGRRAGSSQELHIPWRRVSRFVIQYPQTTNTWFVKLTITTQSFFPLAATLAHSPLQSTCGLSAPSQLPVCSGRKSIVIIFGSNILLVDCESEAVLSCSELPPLLPPEIVRLTSSSGYFIIAAVHVISFRDTKAKEVIYWVTITTGIANDGDLPQTVFEFAMSPDEKKVAVAGSGDVSGSGVTKLAP